MHYRFQGKKHIRLRRVSFKRRFPGDHHWSLFIVLNSKQTKIFLDIDRHYRHWNRNSLSKRSNQFYLRLSLSNLMTLLSSSCLAPNQPLTFRFCPANSASFSNLLTNHIEFNRNIKLFKRFVTKKSFGVAFIIHHHNLSDKSTVCWFSVCHCWWLDEKKTRMEEMVIRFVGIGK